MKVPEQKQYTLTKQEQDHIAHISYTMQHLDHTLNLFMQSVIAGRLGVSGDVKYRLEGDKVIIDEAWLWHQFYLSSSLDNGQ